MFEKALAVAAPLVLSLDASLSSNRLNIQGHLVKTVKVAKKARALCMDCAAQHALTPSCVIRMPWCDLILPSS